MFGRQKHSTVWWLGCFLLGVLSVQMVFGQDFVLNVQEYYTPGVAPTPLISEAGAKTATSVAGIGAAQGLENRITFAENGLFALSRCDYSYCILESMLGKMSGVFGDALSKRPNCYANLGVTDTNRTLATGTPLRQMPLAETVSRIAHYFNIGLIAVLCVVIGYQMLFGAVISPALDGDFSDRNFNIYKVLRIFTGLGLVAPYLTEGYSLLQVGLMYIILLGVGLADSMLMHALPHMGVYPDAASSSSTLSGEGVQRCYGRSLAESVHNHGWLYSAYLYPKMLDASQGAGVDASSGGNSNSIASVLSSKVDTMLQLIRSKNCLNSTLLVKNTQEGSFSQKLNSVNSQPVFSLSRDTVQKNITLTFGQDGSCGSATFPETWLLTSANVPSPSVALSFTQLSGYLNASLMRWLEFSDTMLETFYQLNAFCLDVGGLAPSQSAACTTFNYLPRNCSGSQTEQGCGLSPIPADARAITSPYAYEQYVLKGCRQDSCNPKKVLLQNDFVLYRAVEDNVRIRTLVGNAVGQTDCPLSSDATLNGRLCDLGQTSKQTMQGADNTFSAAFNITANKGGAEYLFEKAQAPSGMAGYAAAIRMVEYALLSKKNITDYTEGRFIPNLRSRAVDYFNQIVANQSQSEQPIASQVALSNGVSPHLNSVSLFLLGALYPRQPFAFMPVQNASIRIQANVYSLAPLHIPEPKSPVNLQTALTMILSRFLGVKYYQEQVNSSNFSTPKVNSTCRETYDTYCRASTGNCFANMRAQNCLMMPSSRGEVGAYRGLLGAAAIAYDYLGDQGLSMTGYNPFNDFVQMGIEVMNATLLFFVVNTKDLQVANVTMQNLSLISEIISSLGNSFLEGRIEKWSSKRQIQLAIAAESALEAILNAGKVFRSLVTSQYTYFSNIANTVMVVLFPIGMLMSIMIPFYPILIFIMGAIAWLVSVFEALISAPIIAVGLAHPDGHDFFGRSTDAVLLTLSSALRPALMVLGVIFSVTLFKYAFLLLNLSMVENMYYIFTSLYAGVSESGPQVFLFLVAGILAIYMYVGWEIVSQISMISVSLGVKILTYLGGQADDLSDIRTRIGTIKRDASDLGSPISQASNISQTLGTQVPSALGIAGRAAMGAMQTDLEDKPLINAKRMIGESRYAKLTDLENAKKALEKRRDKLPNTEQGRRQGAKLREKIIELQRKIDRKTQDLALNRENKQSWKDFAYGIGDKEDRMYLAQETRKAQQAFVREQARYEREEVNNLLEENGKALLSEAERIAYENLKATIQAQDILTDEQKRRFQELDEKVKKDGYNTLSDQDKVKYEELTRIAVGREDLRQGLFQLLKDSKHDYRIQPPSAESNFMVHATRNAGRFVEGFLGAPFRKRFMEMHDFKTLTSEQIAGYGARLTGKEKATFDYYMDQLQQEERIAFNDRYKNGYDKNTVLNKVMDDFSKTRTEYMTNSVVESQVSDHVRDQLTRTMPNQNNVGLASIVQQEKAMTPEGVQDWRKLREMSQGEFDKVHRSLKAQARERSRTESRDVTVFEVARGRYEDNAFQLACERRTQIGADGKKHADITYRNGKEVS